MIRSPRLLLSLLTLTLLPHLSHPAAAGENSQGPATESGNPSKEAPKASPVTPAGKPEMPASALSEVPPDPLYDRDLLAYRGGASSTELSALAKEDPGPALYLGSGNAGFVAVTRLFASLPDAAHQELRRTGYLKWRLDRLPPVQRSLAEEGARQMEKLGDGPFALAGKEPCYIGFASVEVLNVDGPEYFWWVSGKTAEHPGWLTLVRDLLSATDQYALAYDQRMAKLISLAETSPIPKEAWARVKPPTAAKPSPAAKAPELGMPLMDESYYWKVVRAYSGSLGGRDLEKLSGADPLIARRLASKDPADRDLDRLFAHLSKEDHQRLLTSGRIQWRAEELKRGQWQEFQRIVERLNRDASAAGGPALYTYQPYQGDLTGFALIRVPGVEQPVVSWWLHSHAVLDPAWIPLVNGAGANAAGAVQAHLDALSGTGRR